jgi:hypothetical protein
MYSGLTLRKNSGKITGVHQRIDRAARRGLSQILGVKSGFPKIADILHFEGRNGPDALKYTKLAHDDKPWHFINPANPNDLDLLEMINNHMMNLSLSLRDHNKERASYEAAWLAHAITDGLTPAHHFPLSGKVEELWGRPRSEFDTLKEKSIIKGDNRRDAVSRNWEYWGAGGVMTAHIMYELGVVLAIFSGDYAKSRPSENDLVLLQRNGFESLFLESMHRIYDIDMFERYKKHGWTRKLASETKDILIPEIIKIVTLAWYQAFIMSQEAKK